MYGCEGIKLTSRNWFTQNKGSIFPYSKNKSEISNVGQNVENNLFMYFFVIGYYHSSF